MRMTTWPKSLIFSLAAGTLFCLTQTAHSYAFRGTEMRDVTPGQVVNLEHKEKPYILRYLLRSIAEYDEAAKRQATLIVGKLLLGDSRSVEFTEAPKDSIGFYDSTIVVADKGAATRRYKVGELLDDQSLALGYVGIMRSGRDGLALICNYVSQPSEGTQGFVVLRFSASGFEADVLPPTVFGKVVMTDGKPDQIQLWSAVGSEVGPATYPAHYTTRLCTWSNGRYACGREEPRKEPVAPNAIIDPAIEFRPR